MGPSVEIDQERPGWISIRLTFAEPGDFIKLHKHAFDHWMEGVEGAALLQLHLTGEPRLILPGDSILIPAHAHHGARAVRRGTVLRCAHEIRAENGELYPEAFASDGIPSEWVGRLTERP